MNGESKEMCPQPRKVISELGLPIPYQKKIHTGHSSIMNLGEGINLHFGEYNEYPPLQPSDLKELYLDRAIKLELLKGGACFEVYNFLTKDYVFLSNGAVEGLELVLKVYANQGDSIAYFRPSFMAYQHMAKLYGLKECPIDYNPDDLETYSLSGIGESAPKIIVICNPNNPTSLCCNISKVEEMLIAFPNSIVVVDEVYIEFSDERSALHLLHQYKNLVILRTMSKAWGSAGLRVGIVIANPQCIGYMKYVQLPFSMSTPSYIEVMSVLQNFNKMKAALESIRNQKRAMIESLERLECVKKVFPSETNFLLVVFSDAEAVLGRLYQSCIEVANVCSMIDGALKISIGTEEQNKKILDVLYTIGKN